MYTIRKATRFGVDSKHNSGEGGTPVPEVEVEYPHSALCSGGRWQNEWIPAELPLFFYATQYFIKTHLLALASGLRKSSFSYSVHSSECVFNDEITVFWSGVRSSSSEEKLNRTNWGKSSAIGGEICKFCIINLLLLKVGWSSGAGRRRFPDGCFEYK